jgi:hypothetical protein
LLELARPTILLLMLPEVAVMTGAYHTQYFLFSRGLSNIFPGLAWNHDPPNHSLLCSWVIKHATSPSYYWNRISRTFCLCWPGTKIFPSLPPK